MTESRQADPQEPNANVASPATNWGRRIVLWIAFAIVVSLLVWWAAYRWTHSITNDAFVQSRLVNIAPMVAGHAAEIAVEEGQAIRWGEILARLDPLPFERELEVAIANRTVAEAALAVKEATLAQLEAEVPLQIAIAESELQIAIDAETKSRRSLELIDQDVDKGIAAAAAELEAADAVRTNAEEDYRRFSNLFRAQSVSQRRFEEATKVFKTAEAESNVAEARLAQARAARNQIQIAAEDASSAGKQVTRATEALSLAYVGEQRIEVARRDVEVARSTVEEADRNIERARTRLGYTILSAPFDGIVVKRYRNLGDYVPAGAPILTVFNPALVYVTANLEETRLEGVAPGNDVTIHIDAFWRPFRGRVVWVGSATAANFSLIPRDVSSGEFTKIVQRLPVRIWIEPDDRWSLLKPGLSATVAIAHGPGDPEWASQTAAQQLEIEMQAAPPFSIPSALEGGP